MHSYAWRELVRNPRRSLAALTGVALGVGLFSAVLFFADGSGATLTARALAPLALDMQRVLTRPLSSGLRVEERLGAAGLIDAGEPVTITLRVVNDGAEPAHDVVVEDEAPRPLRYIAGSAKWNGAPLADGEGNGPFSQGVAGLGRNIGSVPAHSTVTITYRTRAVRPVRASSVRPRARVSSRESLVPVEANGPRPWTLEQVRARLASIPGVASADALAFVDLPPGALRTRGSAPSGQVRLFAFDRRYREHHPPIRIVSGSFRPGAALLSVEASRALGLRPGSTVELRLPAGRTISLPVSGVLDLTRARALFSSRRSRDLESFLYVPQAIVVSPATFSARVVPALRAASSRLGSVVKSQPVQEVDVLVQRRRLHTNPAAALTQTRAVARSIGRVAPGQDYLIDNISNTLMVARADAAIGKRVFLFLGLPAILLSALVAAYAGSVLAAAQRREHALLRLRGADRRHLRRALAYRALVLAGAGSFVGTVAGFVTARAILGPHALGQAAPRALALSALAALGGGLLVTSLALYVPGRRALAREIAEESRELARSSPPGWRRSWLDIALLGIAAVAALVALRTGALDGASGSVFEGRSVSLRSYLLLIPLLAWIGGVLLAVRVLLGLALRLPIPAWSGAGGATAGLLVRGLRRRPWELAAGAAALGLVIAFGTSLRAFIATYDASKRADARFVVGSDLRIAPGARPRTATYASRLRVRGVSAVTPVVFRPENSLLIGRYRRARTDLAAIDPATFGRTTALSGSSFSGRGPQAAVARLRADPHAILVEAATADELSLEVGDPIRAVLALGTAHEAEASFRVAGVFTRLTGFARPPDLVVGLGAYRAATGAAAVDLFLARTRDHSRAGVDRAARALRSGPGTRSPLAIQTPGTAIDKDQSSLTALEVRSLVDVGSLFTLLMSAAVIGIFLFGLVLARRREYVVLSAQGMDARAVRSLVLGEAVLVAGGGLVSGVLAGAASAVLLVRVLRPLFIIPPGVVVPVDALAGLAAITAAATLIAAGAALAALGRVRPTEILRER